MSGPSRSRQDDLDGRVGRILNDYLDRRAAGRDESESELLGRHPELADHLRLHLALLGELTPENSRIEDLIKQRVLQASPDPDFAAALGPYDVTAIIGRGGMGLVLKAHERALDRTVALKILRPELTDDRTALTRFTLEARAVAGLNHPNIVTVHAVGREGSAHFLAMEFVDGPTLSELIRSHGPLPADHTRRLFRQLLDALSIAHDAGLVHRDVKSSNVLVAGGTQRLGGGHSALTSVIDSASSLKLADFGLARMSSSRARMTVTGSVLGTLEYMSPEQADGRNDLDHRTDLYSAGVVLYEMLTGRTPFKEDTPSAIIHRILHEEPTDPRTVNVNADHRLTSLALRLMAKRPEDRFAQASQAILALEDKASLRLPARQRRARRALTFVVLAFSVVITGVWLASEQSRRARLPTDARVDPDRQNCLQIRLGYGTEWSVFRTFPANVELTSAAAPDIDGEGHRLVVVGARTALDSKGSVLAAYDFAGKLVWQVPLHGGRQWPDCNAPAQAWLTARILAADLDGTPGEELLVVAHDVHECPTRLSIVAPATGIAKSSFWHLGHISEIRLLPDYFADGRPAILAWGHNNKLDGFETRGLTKDEPVTSWDVVSVVMVIDPRQMEGLGPPRTTLSETALRAVRPHAYAFLDLPSGQGVSYAGNGPSGDVAPSALSAAHGWAKVDLVRTATRQENRATYPWLEVSLGVYAPDKSQVRVPHLVVDRHLRLQHLGPRITSGNQVVLTHEYWEQHWHPLIQNGEYIDRR